MQRADAAGFPSYARAYARHRQGGARGGFNTAFRECMEEPPRKTTPSLPWVVSERSLARRGTICMAAYSCEVHKHGATAVRAHTTRPCCVKSSTISRIPGMYTAMRSSRQITNSSMTTRIERSCTAPTQPSHAPYIALLRQGMLPHQPPCGRARMPALAYAVAPDGLPSKVFNFF